jgi:hypothetical protein
MLSIFSKSFALRKYETCTAPVGREIPSELEDLARYFVTIGNKISTRCIDPVPALAYGSCAL